MAENYDIVIAGGGPVGVALALGLNGGPHRVAVLETRSPQTDADDLRTIALSHGSRLLLERLGAWHMLTGVTPINTITVTQQRRFGRVQLRAADAQVPALGYVAGYTALQRALTQALGNCAVDMMTGCAVREFTSGAHFAVVNIDCSGTVQRLDARLVVLADGADSLGSIQVEERDYRQSALVCDVSSEELHQNRAFERFTPDGPLALLPSTNGWSLVWTMRPERAREIAAFDDVRFCTELRIAFGTELGAFRAPGRRRLFPLKLKYTRRPTAPRLVPIGNAAQSLHPVAGQGFNLGLRDAWELASAVRDAHDPGDPTALNAYFSERRFDRTATILFTDTLIRLFSNDIPLAARLGGAGFTILNSLPPVKSFLVRRMIFGARG